MPRKYVILPAIAIGLIAPSWAGTVYTREDAVKIALEKSTEIQSAKEDLVSTTSKVEGGYGAAYPVIDLNATVTRIFGLDDVDMNDQSMVSDMIATGKEKGYDDPSPLGQHGVRSNQQSRKQHEGAGIPLAIKCRLDSHPDSLLRRQGRNRN
jgi:hypothetical protein